jgi:hypothetical protein
MLKRRLWIRVYLLIMVWLYACTSSTEFPDSSASASLFAAHFAPGASTIQGSFGGKSILGNGLEYGQWTRDTALRYVAIGSGVENMLWSHQQTPLLSGNVSLLAGEYYSVFFADTLRNGRPSWFWFKEDTTTIDSVARIRWLPLAPDRDTLSSVLVNAKDTAILAQSVYFDRTQINSPKALSLPFNRVVKPGVYRLEIYRRNQLIRVQSNIQINARSLYTFVWARTSSTGSQTEAILLKNK